jgi:hypothetical protein
LKNENLNLKADESEPLPRKGYLNKYYSPQSRRERREKLFPFSAETRLPGLSQSDGGQGAEKGKY